MELEPLTFWKACCERWISSFWGRHSLKKLPLTRKCIISLKRVQDSIRNENLISNFKMELLCVYIGPLIKKVWYSLKNVCKVLFFFKKKSPPWISLREMQYSLKKMNLHSKMESFYIRSTLSEIIKGGLEVKLPTIWIDGKAEVGRVREDKRRKEKKKEDQRRERVRGKKMQVREEVEKSWNTVFFKWFVTSWLRGVTFFSALCPAVGWLHVKRLKGVRKVQRS